MFGKKTKIFWEIFRVSLRTIQNRIVKIFWQSESCLLWNIPGLQRNKQNRVLVLRAKVFVVGYFSKKKKRFDGSVREIISKFIPNFILITSLSFWPKLTMWHDTSGTSVIEIELDNNHTHIAFHLLKNCYSIPKLIYLLRVSTPWNNSIRTQ